VVAHVRVKVTAFRFSGQYSFDSKERYPDRHHRKGGGLLETNTGRSGLSALDFGMCQLIALKLLI